MAAFAGWYGDWLRHEQGWQPISGELHCVGGPLNGQYAPGPPDFSDWVFEDGKYIYTRPGQHRHGTGACWVWHKFVS